MLKELWALLFGTKKRAAGSVGGTASIVAAVLAFGLPHTMKWEGSVNTAYWDRIGSKWTVCVGETKGVKKGDTYTDAECSDMFKERWQEFYLGMVSCVDGLQELPPVVQAMSTDLAYNAGLSDACKSTMAKHLRAGDWQAACREQLKWNYSGGVYVPGLNNRRKDAVSKCVKGWEAVP